METISKPEILIGVKNASKHPDASIRSAYWKFYNKKRKEYIKDFYSKNRLKLLEENRKWCRNNLDLRRLASNRYRSNPEKISIIKRCSQIWYRKNRRRVLRKTKQYQMENKDSIRYRMRRYNKSRYAIPEIRNKILKQTSEWKKRNPEKVKNYLKRWIKKNPYYVKLRLINRKAKIRNSTINPSGIKSLIKKLKSSPTTICYYCKSVIPTVGCHLDHVFPISKGGNHSLDNLCVACKTCNTKKHSKLVSELNWMKQRLLSL